MNQPNRSGMVEVVCAGNPREMGLAQGAGLREKIHASREILANLEAFRTRQPSFLPYPVYRRLAEFRAKRYLAPALAKHAPATGRQLEGIAEGAGFSLDTLYLLNTIEAAMSSVAACTVSPPLGACSALAVRGRRSASGEPILARNFDYLPLIQPLYTLRDCRPTGGFRSLEFTIAPMVSAVDGLNERGLCITYNYAFAVDEGPRAPPISVAISEALARCATVTEAAAWIASRPRWGGGILMLADADGDIASLELSNTRSALRRPADGEDVIFHTNAFRCDKTKPVQASDKAVYTSRAPAPVRGRRVLESSEKRGRRLAELLARTNRLGPDELAAIMGDHGQDGTPTNNTLCMHGDYWNTTATMQYFPRARRLRISYSTVCQAEYEEIAL